MIAGNNLVILVWVSSYSVFPAGLEDTLLQYIIMHMHMYAGTCVPFEMIDVGLDLILAILSLAICLAKF